MRSIDGSVVSEAKPLTPCVHVGNERGGGRISTTEIRSTETPSLDRFRMPWTSTRTTLRCAVDVTPHWTQRREWQTSRRRRKDENSGGESAVCQRVPRRLPTWKGVEPPCESVCPRNVKKNSQRTRSVEQRRLLISRRYVRRLRVSPTRSDVVASPVIGLAPRQVWGCISGVLVIRGTRIFEVVNPRKKTLYIPAHPGVQPTPILPQWW